MNEALTKQIVAPYEMAVRNLLQTMGQLQFVEREYSYRPTKSQAILMHDLRSLVRKYMDEIRKYEGPVQVALSEIGGDDAD